MSKIKNNQSIWSTRIKKNNSSLFQKVGNESVNHADSRGIKLFDQLPGNSILKISLKF